MNSRSILVVEDEPRAQDLILRSLREAGFRGMVAITRAETLGLLAEETIIAIILDLGLPGDDGLSILREVRRTYQVPVLILTGRAGIRERVSGLEAGADDYLVKPFAPEELVARLRAILRRTQSSQARDTVETCLTLGAARVDLRSRFATGHGTEVRLTERELRILVELARAGGPMPRPGLYRAVLGRDWDALDRSLDVHVSHLRQKLRKVTGEDNAIASIRSEGYELRLPVRFETDSVTDGNGA